MSDLVQEATLARENAVAPFSKYKVGAALRTAEHWISERRTLWERRLDRLGDYLAELPPETPDEGASR